MNENNNINAVPPPIPTGLIGSKPGDNPSERIPITSTVTAFEALLREPRRLLFHLSQTRSSALIISLILITVLCSIIYGIVAGTFSGGMQFWAAPVKITLGLFICGFICLPSLYIFSCLSGSHARLIEILGLVVGLLCLITVLLIGLAPVAWIFSQSTESLVTMGVLHWLFFSVAIYFGLRFLHHGIRSLNASGTGYLKIWSIIFLVVVLQMSTTLRPIIGSAPTFLQTEKKFFLKHWSDCFNSSESNQQRAEVRY